MMEILEVRMEWDQEGSMVVASCNIFDPQGRPIVHVALEHWTTVTLRHLMSGKGSDGNRISNFCPSPSSIVKQCINAKDGADHPILHIICAYIIFTLPTEVLEMLDWDVMLSPRLKEKPQKLERRQNAWNCFYIFF